MAILNNLNVTQAAVNQSQIPTQKQGSSNLGGAAQTDKGGLFKNATQSAQAGVLTDSQAAANEALDGAQKLVARVLDELKNSGSLTKSARIIEQAKQAQIAPNFANDLQEFANSLQTQLQNEPELKEFALKLKEFLRPIADLKTAPLENQIKNSGVMLEANLKNALTGEKLPASIQNLLSNIKDLSDPKLLNQILDLANDENSGNEASFLKLSKILNEAKSSAQNTLEGSKFKQLLTDVDKLDNIAKFIDKSLNKELNADAIKKKTNKISDFTNALKAKISALPNEKLNQSAGFISNFKELNKALDELQAALKSVNSAGDEAGLIKNYEAATGGGENLSLQDKLETAARRLAQTISYADKQAHAAKQNLREAGALIKHLKTASADVAKIERQDSEQALKGLNSDVKNALLNIQDKTQNLQLKESAGKMLAQIEVHQMISALQGGVQTFMPYVWDGAQGGSVAFKRGKKDKFYAQIDLNFKRYGQINVMIGLADKKYIDVSAATQTAEFKDLILSEAKGLKKAISELGLIVSSFSVKTLPKDKLNAKFKNFGGLDVGYDKKA